MDLSKIKVSGFKSFVDPTTITLPSQLVAVVGPNGCGKSNIIDAVTWVMGESSPKYLRGESLTDVIFNGSTSRKPVGQASVELIFDNTDGSMGGEYAKFAEISIKRTINRESDSVYYLNGVRCRKRDVADLFHGTGLGPRSYSFIGQNMISKIVESKPDELRAYLEEAAGISKYNERRRETELRINHTKENLARVNDLCAELEKQLNHLKHQANTAEKYKTLKQQERVLKSELYGIQWRFLDSRIVGHSLNIQREETALEARQSDITKTDRELEQIRHEQRVAHDAFQAVQRHYYAVGNEITRIEQDVLHQQEKQLQWENDLKQIDNDYQAMKNQITEMDDDLQDIEQDIQTTDPLFASTYQEIESLQAQLNDADQAMQTWQNQWDEFNQASAKTAQAAQVEKTNIQHLEQRISSLQQRSEKIQQEQNLYNFSDLQIELETSSEQINEIANKFESDKEKLQQIRHELTSLQSAQQETHKQFDRSRIELQQLRGQQASLQTLQQTALGQRDHAASPWMNQHQLSDKPRLGQHLEVENGWELAVEKVLGQDLQAICVEQTKDILPYLNEFKTGNVCIFSSASISSMKSKHQASLLIDKIKSPWQLNSFLTGIYTADSLEEALKLCESLDIHESVITRDAIWISRTWLKILREKNPAAGVFHREQELKKIKKQIDALQALQKNLESEIEDRKKSMLNLETQRDQLQQSCHQQQTHIAQFNTQHKNKQERIIELKAQSERYHAELLEYREQLKISEADLTQARAQWENALTELETLAKRRNELIKERDTIKHELQIKKENVNQTKDHLHELEIRLQTNKSQKNALIQNIMRLNTQLASFNERKVILESELRAIPPIESLKKNLSRALDKHVSTEVELNSARMSVEALDQEFKNLEEKRQIIEREINKSRNALEILRVEQQGWKVKADTLVEQIKETEFTIEDILKQLEADATIEEWQVKLDQVTTRINRLGAINLVAIEEYTTCLERKQYLDQQVNDLQSGLSTLEDAIAKIDKETRIRFKETFDKVNTRFQELFPTIFGGGKAHLELTTDNLLDTGVTMMACPPGKRNSSIYLLSGGEKSLTAIAFIFSIFYLNPAPFCLLDEVDAALDDANVLRFTRLVKSMSENTQFIFISHNKITIEMGQHLIGVTMNEPGVSRLVSVDIENALQMIES